MPAKKLMQANQTFVYANPDGKGKLYVTVGDLCGSEVFKGREHLFDEVEQEPASATRTRRTTSEDGD